jgi:hypothetical protein
LATGANPAESDAKTNRTPNSESVRESSTSRTRGAGSAINRRHLFSLGQQPPGSCFKM